jgi:very-short-patch-repair endonuclease
LPLEKVSFESAREKSIRHGHISTLHIWWARRPLAASRAAVFATLVPDSDDNYELVKKIVPWEAVKDGNSKDILEARKRVLEANGGNPPKVLDPFAGGGAIPLEALRLGCETYALDLNPVAYLIQKATLEFPQKFGQPDSREVPDYIRAKDAPKDRKNHQASAFAEDGAWVSAYKRNPLATEVRYWGEWVLERAREELAEFYPAETPPTPPGSPPLARGTEGGVLLMGETGEVEKRWQSPPELWSKLKPLVRELRNKPTDAEDFLWQLLRRKQLGIKFRRQHAVGQFILDFYAPDVKLAIELDGGGHAEALQTARDAERDALLAQQGIRTLRFWNHEIFSEPEAVLERILAAIRATSPVIPPETPLSSPR